MANAGCINAYDCNGCLIQTLQNLDSACIGVGVQYTAPNPLDDKRFDYIKYTDKCGCVQCLSAENEILIYATNGVIKNLTLTNDDVNEAIKIKWNDIFGSNRAKTIVRYKTGSYPVSITDGTLAVEETTKNQYSSTPFSLSGVLDETTYYISAFAVDSNGTIIDVQSNVITTKFYKLIECDFTTGYNGFTFYDSHSGVSNGRNNNGLYGYTSDSNYKGCAWKIPSSIYSLGNPLKIELELSGSKVGCGGGISYNIDAGTSRIWFQGIQYRWLNTTVISQDIPNTTPANQVYKFTIDFESKTQYSSLFPSVIQSLPNAEINQIYNYWNAGNLNIVAMLYNSGNLYSYIKKATFKIKAP